jgi:hypothetical protein
MCWSQRRFRFGDLKLRFTSPPAGRGIIPGKEEIIDMKSTPRTTQKMAREAFGLLLEMREHKDAHRLLSQANAFLEMLAREKDANAAPIMLSVRVMQLRKI